MLSTILEIFGSIIGLVATAYISKIALQWLQRYKDTQNKSDLADAISKVQEDSARANQDNDALKKIDGR